MCGLRSAAWRPLLSAPPPPKPPCGGARWNLRPYKSRVRRSLATIPPVFDTARMVAQYRDEAYAPLALAAAEQRADGWEGVRAGAAQRLRLRGEGVVEFGDAAPRP